MYKVLDVAKYVINYAADNSLNITNLKLQKILYYLQAAFLVENNDKCFNEKIVCWQHGPVVLEVYNEFKQYGAGRVPYQDKTEKLVYLDGRVQFVTEDFNFKIENDKDNEIFNSVISNLLPLDAWTLVNMTHAENPWCSAENYNMEITPDIIKEFFSEESNKGRIYGRFDERSI